MVNTVFGFLFYPFKGLDPAWGMIWISLLTGVIMLIIFRFTSNRQGIKKSKAKIGAYILEMRLFNHDLGRMLAALGKTLAANLFYLRYMVVPLIFIIIPVLLVLIQLNYRYERRPLRPGEAVIVKAFLKPGLRVGATDIKLHAPDDIIIETPGLRIASFGEVDWRISGRKEGAYELDFAVNGKQYKKNLHIGGKLDALSAKRVGSEFYTLALNHAEPELPDDSPFASLQIIYPEGSLSIMGFEWRWIIWFFVLSVIFSFAFKGAFKVEL